MDKKILVTYASKYGATAEIARKIGDTLSDEGFTVDTLPVMEVKDISDYGAVVLGSAAYIGQWRKEAANFVRKYEAALSEKPLWLFSSGPTGKGDPVKLLDGWLSPKKLQPVIERIGPRDATVFHGIMQMDKMNAFEKFIVKRIKSPMGDFRDWEAISSWAKSIAEELNKPSI
jgi:menaquinone-dependent protoporphyrinogen oxidase